MAELTTTNNINEIISDKIKKDFVSLLPDDQFLAIVEKVVGDFTKPKLLEYSGNILPSGLERIIGDELEKIFRQRIKELFNTDTFWVKFGYPKADMDSDLGKWLATTITENFLKDPQTLVQYFVMPMLQQFSVNMMNNIRQGLMQNKY